MRVMTEAESFDGDRMIIRSQEGRKRNKIKHKIFLFRVDILIGFKISRCKISLWAMKKTDFVKRFDYFEL